MRRLVFAALILLLSLAGAPLAQGSAFAFCYLDPGQLGGALQPTATGWHWVMVCGESGGGVRTVVSGIQADTLSADTLGQIGQKLANAAKADMLDRGFPSPAAVLLPQTVFVTPQ
jgi:hypothetical protein